MFSFDEHLKEVPPHVAARLTPAELSELNAFLAHRDHIQSAATDETALEVLPEVIKQASAALKAVDRLPAALHAELVEAAQALTTALEGVKPEGSLQKKPVQAMRRSEALKERLDVMRRDI